MKLKWAELSGGSEKQYTDALRVYEVQFEKLAVCGKTLFFKNNFAESW